MLQITRLHSLNNNAESEIPTEQKVVLVRDVFEWDSTAATFAPIAVEERITQVPLPSHPQLTKPGRRRRWRTEQFRNTHQTL